MTIQSEVGGIWGTSLGSLVYYLLVLWAALAGLGMAWGEWQRTRNERVQRLLIAMGGVVLARAVYAVVALVASVYSANMLNLLPPVERFVDTASISFLAWGFMPSPGHKVRIWNWLLGVNVVLAAAVCLVFTRLWGQALGSGGTSDYNGYWQSTVWVVWQLGLVLLASYGAIRNRGGGWGTFLPAMLILFVGGLAQSLFPSETSNVPFWQRIANLVAYPLIAVAVYQEIFAGLRVRSRELQDISQASLDQIKSLLNLFEAGQQTSGSLDLSTVLDNAVRGIARVLDADQCAIVFPDEADSGTMRLVAIYNPTRQGRGEAVTFPLDYQLAVQQAIRRRKPVVVEESENVQLKVLFALLGSGETGPLLVQPLLTKTDAVGAIIAGNARSRRSFTPNEVKLCQSVAGQLGAAIQNARRFQAAQDQIQTLSRSQAEERRQLQQSKVRIQQLTDQLAEARAEAHRASQELKSWEETVREESTQAVLQGLTVGILIADAHGVIQQANTAAGELLDADVEALKGLELAEISNDEQWQRAVAMAGDGQAVRLAMQDVGNTLMCDLAPLPPPAGRSEEGQRLVVAFQDITAAIEEQRQRLNLVQDLDAIRAQERLALAEELRAPTTTIINYTDLLLGEAVGGLGDAQHKFLTRIKSVAERLAQMADDLVREASPHPPQAKPQRQRVDVRQFIKTTVAESSCQLEDRSITLVLELPDDLPTVKTDPDCLRRVLSDLLTNACLASAEGGQIRVQAAEAPAVVEQEAASLNGDGFVMVSVIDSGGGLSDEALQQVFDRSRPSQTPPGLGESGAGLALARTLVEAQGGRLWVESENGVGTTFRFVLPVNDVG